MKKSTLLLALFSVILLSSCKKTADADTTFDQFGISFTCPDGWTVTEAEDNDSYYNIYVEKDGSNSSGIVTIVLWNNEIEPTKVLEIMQEQLQGQKIFLNTKMGESNNGKYGKYEDLTSNYKMNVQTLPHEGIFHIFVENGKTVCITEQYATEDLKVSKPGFEKIKESFTIK